MDDFVMPKIASVGLYSTLDSAKNTSVSLNHKNTFFEIVLPLEKGGIAYIDGESHAILENTVVCCKPGQVRQAETSFKHYYLHLMVGEGQLFDILTSLPVFIELESVVSVKEIFASLHYLFHTKNPEDTILIYSLVLKLIHTLSQFIPAQIVKRNSESYRNRVVELTIEHINANLSSDLSLQKMSDTFNFSPIYFHKMFKSATGKTLHDYIAERRIRKAIDLMLSTDRTLTQIAYECGFSSQSHFGYVFKKKMGVAPRTYAKSISEKSTLP